MEFRVETVYTERDFIAGAAANWIFVKHMRSAAGVLGAVGHITAVPFGLLGVFFFAVSVWDGFAPAALVIGAVFALLAAWLWRSGTPTSANRKLGRALWRAYDKKGETVRLCFDEDGFQTFAGGDAASYRYHALAGAAESRERFVLCLLEQVYFVVNKSDFTQGDPSEFSAFLAEKMGKPLQKMK